MSRVYEALQQSSGTEVYSTDGPITNLPFLKEFDNRNLDLESAPHLEPQLTSNHRLQPLLDRHSFVSEQLRYLGAQLEQLRQTRQLRTVLITSSVAEEGKTVVAASLALSLAQNGKKVLLLEGDLRTPSQCRIFGLEPRPGLAEWCRSARAPTDFLFQVGDLGIWLLPAGLETKNPLDILSSQRMPDLLPEVSRVFDWVLVDSSPVLPMADTGVLSHLCDGVLFVIRSHKTQKSALKQALARLEQSKLLGFVLNDFPGLNQYGYDRYYKKIHK